MKVGRESKQGVSLAMVMPRSGSDKQFSKETSLPCGNNTEDATLRSYFN